MERWTRVALGWRAVLRGTSRPVGRLIVAGLIMMGATSAAIEVAAAKEASQVAAGEGSSVWLSDGRVVWLGDGVMDGCRAQRLSRPGFVVDLVAAGEEAWTAVIESGAGPTTIEGTTAAGDAVHRRHMFRTVASSIAVDGDTIWVALNDAPRAGREERSRVVALSRDLRVVKTAVHFSQPVSDIEADGGDVLVATGRAVVRVSGDAPTWDFQARPVNGFSALLANSGAGVWTASGRADGTGVVELIEAGSQPIPLTGPPRAVTADQTGAWVLYGAPGDSAQLVRFRENHQRVAEMRLTARAASLALGRDVLWVGLSGGDTALRLDPRSGAETGRIRC